jgi:hypothetical protein
MLVLRGRKENKKSRFWRDFFEEILVLLCVSENFLESFWVELSEFSQDFAVETDILFLESAHELRVRNTFLAAAGIDLDLPKAAAVRLLVAAVSERVGAGMHKSIAGCAFFIAAAKTETLGSAQYFSSTFEGMYSSFYSWHIVKLI